MVQAKGRRQSIKSLIHTSYHRSISFAVLRQQMQAKGRRAEVPRQRGVARKEERRKERERKPVLWYCLWLLAAWHCTAGV